MATGSFVTLQNLVNSAENNGLVCRVINPSSETNGRVTVHLLGLKKLITVKPNCIRPSTSVEVAIGKRKALEELSTKQLLRLLISKGQTPAADATSESLIDLCVTNDYDAQDLPPSQPAAPVYTNETITVSKEQQKRLDDMSKQADDFERMSSTQLREAARNLKGKTPAELASRGGRGATGQLTEKEIKQQIDLLELMARNPSYKRYHIGTLRNGGRPRERDMDQLDDEGMKQLQAQQLELFLNNPDEYLATRFAQTGDSSATKESVEQELRRLAAMPPSEFRELQRLSKQGASGGAAPVNMSNVSGATLRSNIQMQLDMLNRDPAQFRALIGKQAPQLKDLDDQSIRELLESSLAQSDEELKAQAQMSAASGGDPSKMTPPTMAAGMEQLEKVAKMKPSAVKAMLKMQAKDWGKDPDSFMSKWGLDPKTFTDLAEEDIARYQSYYLLYGVPLYNAYLGLESVTGQYTRYIVSFVLTLLLLSILYLLFQMTYAVFKLVRGAFGFGGDAAKTTSASQSYEEQLAMFNAQTGGGGGEKVAQVDVGGPADAGGMDDEGFGTDEM